MIEDPELPADCGVDAVSAFGHQEQLASALHEVEADRDGSGELALAGPRYGQPHVADATLLGRLLANGLRGPEYDAFILELTKYGLAVMTAWTIDGTAFARAGQLGRPVSAAHRPSTRRISRDDAVAIADITVTLGLRLFDKMAFRKRVWRPDGGASTKTYFIGSCLLTLSNACRAWRADTPANEIPTDDPLAYLPTQRDRNDPEDIVVVRALIEEAIGPEPDRVRRMLAMAGSGYTHREIAEMLGTTERAVEGELYRARRRARLRLQGGDNGANHSGLR